MLKSVWVQPRRGAVLEVDRMGRAEGGTEPRRAPLLGGYRRLLAHERGGRLLRGAAAAGRGAQPGAGRR